MESEVERLRKQLQESERLREEAQQREQEAERLREEEQRLREEAQQREQEAERLREEEQRLREEAQQREQEAERLREEDRHRYERRTGKTTLPEFLDACHTHLSLGLTIQSDSTQSTQGNAANAENKPRPDRILPWPEFDAEQAHTWETLMESDFVLERHFTSLHTLEESGEAVRRRQMGSELDLNTFARFTVEDPVSQIIERLSEDKVLRARFGLKGSVRFENHSNTLSPDRAAEDIQSLSISEKPRRSKRLRANNPGQAASQAATSTRTTESSRPRADQFCVYNISGTDGETEHRVPALTIEYKAPHKLTLGHIYEGLGEMELDEVVEVGEDESLGTRCRRLVAAVITQGYSYMVRAGVEYGEIYTGEATIFLRVLNDPSTVYYSLSVPKGDVGPMTDWSEHGDQPNRLHLTAVGQAVAFTLRALQTPARDANWRARVLRRLKTWNVVVKDIEETIADDEVLSSEYRPSPGANSHIIRSPIQFRPRKKKSDGATCASATSSFSSNDDNHPDTPSRPPQPSTSSGSRPSTRSTTQTGERSGRKDVHGSTHHQRNLGRFCTPQCLMGIIGGGALDRKCPNVKEHGKAYHHLNRETFMQQIGQLFHDQLDYCEEMNIHGARGALYKVRLPRFGYTVIAKATGIECVGDLIHESAIYRRLLPIQGRYVPVHLGDIEVDSLLYYAGAVRIVHMMFLSFGGFPIRAPIPATLADEAIRILHVIHQLGVLQKDFETRHILVHPDRPGMTWIDFERAALLSPRVALGSLSANRKRKLEFQEGARFPTKSDKECAKEIVKATAKLTRLVGSISRENRKEG
jgi:hypothetical protein